VPSISDQRIVLFALIAFNLAVKLLWLGANDLAHDEPFTVYWSQRPLAEFKEMLFAENNPPLHFLITRWWSQLVPFEAAWLRVPSAIFSALAVWPLYLIGRKLGGERTALITALLFSLSNYHYGYAHEVRAYALFTLLACWSAWLVVRRMGDIQVGWLPLLQLALVNTVMVYTHYFGWLMMGVQGLFILLAPGLRPWRGAFAVGTLITAALFGPMLLVFLKRAGESLGQGTWLTYPVPEELYNMVWKWSNAPVVAAASIILIVAGIARRQRGDAAMRLAIIWGLVPLIGLFMLSQFKPMFLDRYLVFSAPGFALLVALCIQESRLPQLAANLTGAALVVAMAVTFSPWKKGLYQPSRVAAQVDAWCASDCHVEVVPPWYWLNLKAGKGIAELRQDQAHLLGARILVPDPVQARALGPYVLVDASGNDESAWVRDALRLAYDTMQVAEPDHRLRVFLFNERQQAVPN